MILASDNLLRFRCNLLERAYSWLSIMLLSRGLKENSNYREFEFSKSLIKTVKIDTGGFEKVLSSLIFFWQSQLQHSVLNYQSTHGPTSFPCSVQGTEFCPYAFQYGIILQRFQCVFNFITWSTRWWRTFFIILIIFVLFIRHFNNFGDDIIIIKERSRCDNFTIQISKWFSWWVWYYTLVLCLKSRRCNWRLENQVDVREVLDFRMRRAIANQKGNLSALTLKGWVDLSYPLFKLISCHPTFFLCPILAGSCFTLPSDKHFQLFPSFSSGCHACQFYFTVLASRILFSR